MLGELQNQLIVVVCVVMQMKTYFAMFGELFAENLPRLSEHFLSISLTAHIYILDWIFTMFARALPLDVTMRLWDVFFWHGEEFLFRAALGKFTCTRAGTYVL